MTKEVVANIQYGGDYAEKLREAAESGECVFCQDTFQRDSKFFLMGYQGWIARKSEFPTKDVLGGIPDHHILIVPERHVGSYEDLANQDHVRVSTIVAYLRSRLGIRGGGLVHRLGHPLYSGATVLHVHFHFVVPRIIEIDGEPRAVFVNMPIG